MLALCFRISQLTKFGTEPNSQSKLSTQKQPITALAASLLVVKLGEGFYWWMALREGCDWPV